MVAAVNVMFRRGLRRPPAFGSEQLKLAGRLFAKKRDEVRRDVSKGGIG